jgi:subtilisin family serine protease
LFNVKCDNITWAVLDSGIDGKHPVFKDKNDKPRIKKAYDFSNIRKIVSLDNLQTDTAFETRLDELMMQRKEKLPNAVELPREEAKEHLRKLADDAQRRRPIHWELVEKFIEIDPETPPKSVHGTHVAGIIGGYAKPDDDNGFASGMAPDIKFYDFRVLAKTIEDTEFAIIAALQFLRYLNERNTYLTIHGANLSLSIPHDVRNFACGRTPICVECERLVENGVVVVAAAGNLGYQRFETKDGSYEGYTAFSITDPGNADGVITVGATHRFKPHTYGVSFFSSRGPTGDGRLKPDLVAPGERIESSLPKGEWGELDGTSMAAPHVSGAAAMLMARYDELIGEPRRIKQILCESATDLGRERSFQGHGMLDVLRAFQSI